MLKTIRILLPILLPLLHNKHTVKWYLSYAYTQSNHASMQAMHFSNSYDSYHFCWVLLFTFRNSPSDVNMEIIWEEVWNSSDTPVFKGRLSWLSLQPTGGCRKSSRRQHVLLQLTCSDVLWGGLPWIRQARGCMAAHHVYQWKGLDQNKTQKRICVLGLKYTNQTISFKKGLIYF